MADAVRWRRVAVATALLAAVALLLPGTAFAHPSLVGSSPELEAVAPTAPRSVELAFSEPVVAEGSRVRVLDSRGRAVPVGPAAASRRSLAVPIRGRLVPGVYLVRWEAIGADGHVVSGAFRFGSPSPDGSPPPGVERLGSPLVQGGGSVRGDGGFSVALRWLGIVFAGVLLAGAVVRSRLPAKPGRAKPGRLATVAVVGLALASWYAAARASEAGGRDPSLDVLLAQPTGVLALVRLGLAVVIGGAALWVRSAAASRVLLGCAGAAALVTYALDGHVQTAGTPLLAYSAQVLHVLAAGMWMGGLVVLALGVAGGTAPIRSFAPLAAACVAVLALTGVAAAWREVDAWYFLRWSGYGRVVIAKAVLLLALAPAALVTVRALRRGRRASTALRVEAAGALAIVVLAATLAGLPPGRGQPLPAQRGNLLVGASFTTVVADGVPMRLTLAPARPGANVLSAVPDPGGASRAQPGSLTISLHCACAPEPVTAVLRRGPSGTWSAPVDLPARGSFVATASAGSARSQAAATPSRATVAAAGALAVGDPPVPGSTPRRVTMTADLSGASAMRCRAQAQGAILALGRFDAQGGLPGGRKVVLDVRDDGGDPRRAAALVRDVRDHGAIALLGPCGAGAEGALEAAGALPTIATEPGAPPVAGPHLWRIPGDARAEGVAIGRYLLERSAAGGSPRAVSAVVVPPAHGSGERLVGLRSVLDPAGVRLTRLPPEALESRALDPRRYAAAFVDGDPARTARLLKQAGDDPPKAGIAPVVASAPLLDEGFQENAGNVGSAGAIASPSEILPRSADGVRYTKQMRLLFPSDRPQIAGLRGYVAGLALAEGLADGDDPGEIAARLRTPRPFTDALVAPWRPTQPQDGPPLFVFLSARFLSPALVAASGGHQHSAGYFTNGGSWVPVSTRPYGPER